MNLKQAVKHMMAASVALLFLGVTPRAYAGTVTTNSDSGAGSLRSIIAAAAAGETINFAPSVTGTIALTSTELVIAKNLTITGPGASVLEISGSNARRVFNITSGTVSISDLTVTEGLAINGAGINNSGSLALARCVIFNNHTTSGGVGAGIASIGGGLTMSDCVVYLNEASAGAGLNTGGLFGGGETVTLRRCSFHSNNSSVSGGAIRSVGSQITINDSTLHGNGVNSSTGTVDSFSGIVGGGAFVNTGSSTAVFNNCTIFGNSVSASALESGGVLGGGGIANPGGTVVLHNTTVADNQVFSTATTTIPTQGGGIYSKAIDSVNTIVGGSIVARNVATTGPDFRGPAVSQGFNLIGKRDGSSGFPLATDRTGTIASPLDPKLAASIQGNQGTTATLRLLPGSPALDKGKDFVGVGKDQRGKPRPYDNAAIANAPGGDGSDIGALENQAPDVTINDPAMMNEGGATAPGSVNFTITLSAPSPQTVVVNYKTTDGTAIAGSDYVAKSGRVSFAPGETRKLVSVIFIGDSAAELNETLYLDLTLAVNATLSNTRGATSIRNDDGPAINIFDAVAVDEGNSEFTLQKFIVRLRAASTDTIKVDWTTANDTAGTGDFVAASGTLTFAPGQTSKLITIQIKGDTTVELNETYKVNLSNPTYAILEDAQAIGTIRNDDFNKIGQDDEPSE